MAVQTIKTTRTLGASGGLSSFNEDFEKKRQQEMIRQAQIQQRARLAQKAQAEAQAKIKQAQEKAKAERAAQQNVSSYAKGTQGVQLSGQYAVAKSNTNKSAAYSLKTNNNTKIGSNTTQKPNTYKSTNVSGVLSANIPYMAAAQGNSYSAQKAAQQSTPQAITAKRQQTAQQNTAKAQAISSKYSNLVSPTDMIGTNKADQFVKGVGTNLVSSVYKAVDYLPNLLAQSMRESQSAFETYKKNPAQLEADLKSTDRNTREIASRYALNSDKNGDVKTSKFEENLMKLLTENFGGDSESAQTFGNAASMNRQEFKNGMGTVGGHVADAAFSAADMMNSGVIGYMTGTPMTAVQAIFTGAQQGMETLGNNYNAVQSADIALGSGVISYLTEQIGGIQGKYLGKASEALSKTPFGEKLTEAMGKTATKLLSNKVLNFVASAAKDANEEALEELAEGIADTFLSNAVLNKNDKINLEEIGNDMIAAAIVGGFFGGFNSAQDSIGALQIENQTKKSYNDYVKQIISEGADRTAVINEGLQLTANSQAAQNAQLLYEKMSSGTQLTDKEIAQQARLNDIEFIKQKGHEIYENQTPEFRKDVDSIVENVKNSIGEQNEEYADLPTLSTSENKSFRELRKLSERLGTSLELVDNLAAEGYYDGKIHINKQAIQDSADSSAAMRRIFTHELTHHLEQSGTYGELAEYVLKSESFKNYVMAKNYESVEDYAGVIADVYGKNGAIDEDAQQIQREMVANFASEQILTDETSIKELAITNKGLFDRVVDWLKALRVKLFGTSEEKFISNALKLYRQAAAEINESEKTQKNNAPMDAENSKEIEVGRNTVIKKPYEGIVPIQTKKPEGIVSISEENFKKSVDDVKVAIEIYKTTGTKTFKALKDKYKKVFDDLGGVRRVSVENMSYQNAPYTVDLNKNIVKKVISDVNLSAEKLAVFYNIDDIVKNAEYLGSGEFSNHSKRNKQDTRYDYFETLATIGGKQYVVSFDVEVLPNDKNNYRTHKIKEMSLTHALLRKSDPQTPAENVLNSFDTSLPHKVDSVNNEYANTGREYSYALDNIENSKQIDIGEYGIKEDNKVHPVHAYGNTGQLLDPNYIFARETDTPIPIENAVKLGKYKNLDVLEAANEANRTAVQDVSFAPRTYADYFRQAPMPTDADAPKAVPEYVPKPMKAPTNKSFAEQLRAESVEYNIEQLKQHRADDNKELATKDIEKIAGKKIDEIGTDIEFDTSALNNKAERFIKARSTNLLKDISQVFGIPKGAANGYMKPIISELSDMALEKGYIDRAHIKQAFDTAYDNVTLKATNEMRETYGDIKKELRSSNIKITPDIKGGMIDFENFRKSNMGRLRFAKDGIDADVRYSELNGKYPGLFPSEITNPADQVIYMAEVSRKFDDIEKGLDDFHGENAEEFKELARYEFEKKIDKFAEKMREVHRYADDLKEIKTERQSAEKAREDEVKTAEDYSVADLLEMHRKVKAQQKLIDKMMTQTLLTKLDKEQIELIANGTISADQINPDANIANVNKIGSEKKKLKELWRPILDSRELHKSEMKKAAQSLIVNSGEWKDKIGLQYSAETMERNIRDIVSRDEDYRKIVDKYFRPVHEHVAEGNKFKNLMRSQIKALNLTEAESQFLQLYGEQQYVEGEKKARRFYSKAELENLNRSVDEWHEKYGNEIDMDKVSRALETFHELYDEMFSLINEAYIRNGYEPISYRKGYFPHYGEHTDDRLMNKLARDIGFTPIGDSLPTDIAGLTYTFRPGRKWFANGFERNESGKLPDNYSIIYDAVEGFDKYIETAADIIFLTEDIQNLRTFEEQIRYKHSETGVKDAIDAINEDIGLTFDDRSEKIAKVYDDAGKQGHLGNFVQELCEYTNILAGKKSTADRSSEKDLGRGIYTVMKDLEGRVAANMVALNPASWATNFIVITQASGEMGTLNTVKGMQDTLKAILKADAIDSNSVFLTNRRGSDPLRKSGIRTASEVLTMPMTWIDEFASGTIVRARYNQNIKKGMNELAAMREADAFAASVIADRSKGAMPTMFENKNPLAKAFTMFQLEANNQFRYLLKDMPYNKREEGTFAIAAALMRYFVGAYLFNDLYEKIVGRRPALDLLGMTNSFVGDLFGYELPNTFDMISDAIKGNEISFDSEKQKTSTAIENLIGNFADNLPAGQLITGLSGIGDGTGGRLPIQSAVPDLGNLAKLFDEDISGKKKLDIITQEIINKPLLYTALPFGGGAVKKGIDAFNVIKNSGDYAINNDGEKELRFAADYKGAEKVAKAAKIALFGKYSTAEGQDYVKNGFKRLSASKTDSYIKAPENGVDREQFLGTLDKLSDFEAIKNSSGETIKTVAQQEREYINNMDLSDTQKAWYIENALMDKTDKGKLEDAKAFGLNETEYILASNTFKDMGTDRDSDGKIVKNAIDKKREWILNNKNLSVDEKKKLDEFMFGNENEDYSAPDYSNKDSFTISQWETTKQVKYKAVTKYAGMKVENYEKSYAIIYKDGVSKEEKLKMLVDIGMSEAGAQKFWEVMHQNYYDKNNLTKSQQAKLEKVQGQGLSKEMFDKCYPIVIYVGASKEDKLARLMKCGLTRAEAERFYSDMKV